MAAPLLLLSDDEALTSAVGRLAAAAGVDLVVDPGHGGVPSSWSSAAAVLVGADVAARTAVSPPSRRDLVHVVCPGPAPDPLFRLAVALGASSVVELPDGEAWLAGVLADLGDEPHGPGTVLAVVPGSGGAGATTFAAALALAAAAPAAGRPGPVALVDLDPLGPGLAGLLGRDGGSGEPGPVVTWPELGGSRGRLGARELRTALRARDGVGVLGWGRRGAPRTLPSPTVLHEVVSALRRGHAWVVLDVPRHAVGELGPVLGCDAGVVVARPAWPALASATEVVSALAPLVGRVHVVVRGDDVAADQVARILGVPGTTVLRHHRRLDEHLDLGLGPVHGRRNPVATAADEVLRALGSRRAGR